MAPTIFESLPPKNKNRVREERRIFGLFFFSKKRKRAVPPTPPLPHPLELQSLSLSLRRLIFHTTYFSKRLLLATQHCYSVNTCFSTIFQYTTSVQLRRFTANNLMLIILIMFCTDVLRAWAECSLKDFSQAFYGGGRWVGGGCRGLGYRG